MSTHERKRLKGEAILKRLQQHDIPPALKVHVAAFRAAQDELTASMSAFDDARQKGANALDAVHAQDAALDHAIRSLAARMIGAEIGRRGNPFARYSRYTPSHIQRLGYATEIKEVRKLVARILRRSVPSDVERAANECLERAEAVETAIADLSGPQARHQHALQLREAAAHKWAQQLRRLRLNAAAAWANEIVIFRALFAPPSAVLRPARRVRRRKRRAL